MAEIEKTKDAVVKYGDYVLILRPEREDEKWTGNIVINTVGLVSEDTMDKKEYSTLMTSLGLMYAAFDMMEDDANFFDMLYDHAENICPALFDHIADATMDRPKISFTDNVITLDFDTPTGGKA